MAVFQDLIDDIRSDVNRSLESIPIPDSPKYLYDPIRYSIRSGGKRFRPVLTHLSGKANNIDSDVLMTLSLAVELLHNFTLVHDDIMDDDDVRRGRPAVHIEYGLPTAINAGDAMLAIAFEALSVAEGLDPVMLPFLVKRIGRMVRRVSEGQQLDIEFEDRLAVSEDEYLEMIRGKTAVMFLTCAEVGAHMAGADEETIECMHDWGLAVGMCFQLMDDLIDVVSDSETLGKPTGSDVVQGKRTLMVIHALSQDDCKAKENLLSVLGIGESASDEQIALGRDSLEELGSIAYAREKAEEYHATAHLCLDRLVDGPALQALRELTDYQLNRLN